MKLNIKLPQKFETKWARLLAYQGGDPEALALTAVEMLWDAYGADVRRLERRQAYYARRIKDCESNLPSGKPGKAHAAVDGKRKRSEAECLFVGRFDVALDGEGSFAIPAEWHFALQSSRSVFLMLDEKAKCINLIPCAAIEKEGARSHMRSGGGKRALAETEERMCRIEIDDKWRVKVPARFRRAAKIAGSATLLGTLRYIKIVP